MTFTLWESFPAGVSGMDVTGVLLGVGQWSWGHSLHMPGHQKGGEHGIKAPGSEA